MVLVVALAIAVGPPTDATPRAAVPPSVADAYTTRRPPLGPTTVVDISAATNDEKLLATTLQGQLNRDVAQIYLVGSSWDAPAIDQAWIDRYVADGLVSVAATTDLAGLLDAHAASLPGYVLADPARDWEVNAATTIATATGAVVATPATVGLLTSRGVGELDDVRNRWPDAVTAYTDLVDTYRSQLAYPGVAVASPGVHGIRDFTVQQGILTLYTRPETPGFDQVMALIDRYPTGHPVYGTISSSASQEVIGVGGLSLQGRYLVPTGTMNNLSFHLAVGADEPRVPARPPSDAADDCGAPGETLVALSVSDADNLRVPLSPYDTNRWWNSPRRGDLPLGWSLPPSVAILMPAIWDRYADELAPSDELVSMMGLGYTFAAVWPDARPYYRDAFAADAALGLDTHWSLDVFLREPDHPGWDALLAEAQAPPAGPSGILVNYGDFGGDHEFRVDGGRLPVLTSRQDTYDTGDDGLIAQLTELAATLADERPPVAFYSVTVWISSLDGLADGLLPLEEQGLRFVSPAHALRCVPREPGGPTGPDDPSTPTPPADAVPAAARPGSPTYTG